MFNNVNVMEDVAGTNPCSFGRNLFKEMFDGRMDVVLTDNGRQPVNSTRSPVSLPEVSFIKSNKLFFIVSKTYFNT